MPVQCSNTHIHTELAGFFLHAALEPACRRRRRQQQQQHDLPLSSSCVRASQACTSVEARAARRPHRHGLPSACRQFLVLCGSCAIWHHGATQIALLILAVPTSYSSWLASHALGGPKALALMSSRDRRGTAMGGRRPTPSALMTVHKHLRSWSLSCAFATPASSPLPGRPGCSPAPPPVVRLWRLLCYNCCGGSVCAVLHARPPMRRLCPLSFGCLHYRHWTLFLSCGPAPPVLGQCTCARTSGAPAGRGAYKFGEQHWRSCAAGLSTCTSVGMWPGGQGDVRSRCCCCRVGAPAPVASISTVAVLLQTAAAYL